VYPTLTSYPVPDDGYTEASWVSEDGSRWGLLLGNVFEYFRLSSGVRLATRSLELPESPHVDVSSDGKWLLVCAEGKVSVWDIEEGRRVREVPLKADNAWVDAWFWDRSGTRILVTNEDQASLCSVETGEALWTLSGEAAPTRLLAVNKAGLALAFNPLSGQGGLLDSQGRWLARLDGLHGANHAAFSSDGRAAVLMSGDGGVWDLDASLPMPAWRALQPQQADRSNSNRMSSHAVFTGGGDTLWFISRHRLYTFERGSGELSELSLPAGFVPTQLCAGQDQVAVGTDHGLVAFFTIKGEQLIAQGLAHEGPVLRLAGIAFGAGRWASLGRDGSLQLWARPDEFSSQPLSAFPGFGPEPVPTGEERALLVARLGLLYAQVLAAHPGTPEPRLSLNASGDRLLSAGNDGLVRLWSVPEHELLLSLEAPAPLVEEVRFSSDGLRLGASVSPRGASFPFSTLWHAEDWRARAWLRKPYAEEDEAEAYKAWLRRNFKD
jgi:WD40 repeat protein